MRRVQRVPFVSMLALCVLMGALGVRAFAETGALKDAPFAFGKARVEFHASSVVQGGSYTLGEIATIKTTDPDRERRLACLVLGKSPALGSRTMLNVRSLEQNLDRLGVTEEATLGFPERIFIQRDVQDLDLESLRKMIEKEVRKELSGQSDALFGLDKDLVIERMQLPKSLRIPSGDVSYKTDFRLPRQGVGAVSFQVEILIDGVSTTRVSGTLYVDRMVPVLKVQRAVARGSLMSPEVCKETMIRLSEVRGTPVRAEELPKALRTKRDLNAGDLLTWYNVEREILVERGQTVHLVLQVAGMRISTLGRVSSRGALGDLVEVVNAQSGKKLRGRVVDRETIRVSF